MDCVQRNLEIQCFSLVRSKFDYLEHKKKSKSYPPPPPNNNKKKKTLTFLVFSHKNNFVVTIFSKNSFLVNTR